MSLSDDDDDDDDTVCFHVFFKLFSLLMILLINKLKTTFLCSSSRSMISFEGTDSKREQD